MTVPSPCHAMPVYEDPIPFVARAPAPWRPAWCHDVRPAVAERGAGATRRRRGGRKGALFFLSVVLCVLPIAWLAGGGVGLLAQGLPALPVPALSFLVLGTLVAADLRLSPTAVTMLAVGLGLVHGALNGVAMRQAGVGALGLLGITATLCVLVALVAAFVVSLQRPWTRIVVRVAGSWIAAVGLLMLGWALRGGY